MVASKHETNIRDQWNRALLHVVTRAYLSLVVTLRDRVGPVGHLALIPRGFVDLDSFWSNFAATLAKGLSNCEIFPRRHPSGSLTYIKATGINHYLIPDKLLNKNPDLVTFLAEDQQLFLYSLPGERNLYLKE